MARQPKRRVRIKPRFYVIVTAFVGLIALAVWGIVSLIGGGPTVEWGGLATDQTVNVLIVRDEQVIQAGDYASRAEALVAEGETVTAGEAVLNLYTAGYSEKEMQNYLVVQQKIKDAQENDILKNIVDATLEDLNTRIDAKQEELSTSINQGEFDKLLRGERELAQLMEERRVYMKELTSANTTEYLEGLYQSESQLLERINATRLQATSPMDGVVSFFLDGFQNELRPDTLDQLTAGTVLNIVERLQAGETTNASTAQIAPETPLARVVNPNLWYAVMVLPAAENTLVEGQTCELSMDGYGEPLLDAQVIRVAPEGANHLVVLQLDAPIGAMVSLRKVSGHLGGNVEGFKIPLAAVMSGESGSYVTVQEDGQTQNVAIQVLASDESSAIVSPLETEGGARLAVGQKGVLP